MTTREAKTEENRRVLRDRAREVIQIAWDINGLPTPREIDPVEDQLRILNGLLALSMVEVMAPAHTGSGMLFDLVRLGKVLDR